MLFNSLEFMIFFPVVTILFFTLPQRWRWLLLLLASCVFYMFFIPIYLLILVLTITVDYIAGIYLTRTEGIAKKRVLLMSILANVGVLFFFKYYNFATDNLLHLAALIHWNYPLSHLAIILPIGLSFHTFQSMSYTIEVYRGKQPAERHFGVFALYVMFYPQLVAGPIERPQNLLHQFWEEKTFDYDRMKSGLKLMTWGMFKKIVIADRVAEYVNRVYTTPTDYHGLALLLATLLFAVQIYCDFSGYSDIAIGAARVMGFKLMTNFNMPYTAASIREFWSRWHISLSTWFKDYLYIPLGGNRLAPWRRYLNLFIVFVVSGVWHGANWTFIIWGALHGLYQIVTVATEKASLRLQQALGLARFPALVHGGQVALTFTLVTIAWVFFRAKTVAMAWYILQTIALDTRLSLEQVKMAVFAFTDDNTAPAQFLTAVLLIGLLIVTELWGSRWYAHLRRAPAPAYVRQLAWASMIVLILMMGRFTHGSFIYFQF